MKPRMVMAVLLSLTPAWACGGALNAKTLPPLTVQMDGVDCNDLAALTIEQERKCVQKFVNQKRVDAGRQTLMQMDTLNWGAQQHCQDMRDADDLFHSTDLVQQMNTRLGQGEWYAAGENIGVIGLGSPAPFDGLMDAFWESDPHRQNFMKPAYNKIGIGCATDNSTGKWWVTVWLADTIP